MAHPFDRNCLARRGQDLVTTAQFFDCDLAIGGRDKRAFEKTKGVGSGLVDVHDVPDVQTGIIGRVQEFVAERDEPRTGDDPCQRFGEAGASSDCNLVSDRDEAIICSIRRVGECGA